jgi:Spy/CpxP family protein refolding chaperone
MHAKTIALIAALAGAAAPVETLAQTNRIPNLDAELRMRQAQEDLRNFQLRQQQQELTTRLDNLELQTRSQQQLDALSQRAEPRYQPVDQTAVRNVPTVIDLNAQNDMADKELSAQNERLRRYDRQR